MKYIGFSQKEEFLPSFDKFQNEVNKRLMFLKFFNQEVCCKQRFTKEELKEVKSLNLCMIFSKKILKNLQLNSFTQGKVRKIDIAKSIKINRFFKNVEANLGVKIFRFNFKTAKEKSDIKTAISLIKILEKSDYSLYLEGEKIFKNFVSNKILKSTENREVCVHEDSIDIKCEEHMFNTKIFTFWEFIDSKKLSVDSHIKKAVKCIENSEFKQVYLVYPKNENFDRHIQIRTNELDFSDYEIKLIPYSLRSTLR